MNDQQDTKGDRTRGFTGCQAIVQLNRDEEEESAFDLNSGLSTIDVQQLRVRAEEALIEDGESWGTRPVVTVIFEADPLDEDADSVALHLDLKITRFLAKWLVKAGKELEAMLKEKPATGQAATPTGQEEGGNS
jgi:hypothetical protein